jgi:hypothetical protein
MTAVVFGLTVAGTATLVFAAVLLLGTRLGPWVVVEGHPGGYAGAGDPIEPDEWQVRRCWTRRGALHYCDRHELGYPRRYRPWAEERGWR